MKEDLLSVLQQFFTRQMSGVHTAIPASVQEYDADKKTISALPLLKMKFATGTVESMPIIQDVPVIFPGSADAVIQFPLAKGDGVLLIFSERSIEDWAGKETAEVETTDPRRFSLSDAIAIPGLFSPAKAGKMGDGDALELLFKDSKIILNKDGKITVNNNKAKIEMDGKAVEISNGSGNIKMATNGEVTINDKFKVKT